MKVGIIGAGLIGEKRSLVTKASRPDEIKWIIDIDLAKASKLAQKVGGQVGADWNKVVNDPKIDVIVVATTHDWLAKISLAALKANKHVLCEKPLGISSKEVKKCVDLAKRKGLVYKAGYNHRFHPAILRANKLFVDGKIGELMYIKADYGHGGRPGYENEWRMNKNVSGGGELIDQGAHLLDLANWFMDSVESVQAELMTGFWPIKVEDNAFIILKNKKQVAQLHSGWTEWKNRFVFELYGTKGYLHINGLGGSYGVETLIWGQRVPGKAPKEKVWKFAGEDVSWKKEWINLKNAIKRRGEILGSGNDGLEVLELVEKIYIKQ